MARNSTTHRKRQQAQHPKLTFTDLYNVLEKLSAGTPLNAREQLTHEQGLVTVLRQLHDDLDAAVAEERDGQIRWLRPSFQAPTNTATQTTLATDEAEPTTIAAKSAAKLRWPKSLAEQAQAVRAALSIIAAPADAATLAKTFKSAKPDRIADLLETLASLGQARALGDGRFMAA